MTRRLADRELLIATHNDGKLAEMAALLTAHGRRAIGASALGLPEPAETGATFAENAAIKALTSARAAGRPALADDSGLCIDSLGGAPGVATADWAKTATGRDYLAAMQRAENAMNAVQAPRPRVASFHCVLVVAWPDGLTEVFGGVTAGHLVWPPRGRVGHGYDPVFVPEGFDRSFAEMEAAEKNRVSHRGRAFAAFADACFG